MNGVLAALVTRCGFGSRRLSWPRGLYKAVLLVTGFPENGVVAPALPDLAPVLLILAWGGWYGTDGGGAGGGRH